MAIAQALLNSNTYHEYRKIVTRLIADGRSSGQEQSDELLHYSLLNDTRMNRLDKTIVISTETIATLLSLKKNYIWLVLSESWCGDAAQLLPIMNKMAIASPSIELKVAFRDENLNLMDRFLSNGGRSIPKLLLLDADTLNVIGNWGPRPKGASHLIKSYKEQYGVIDETAKTELQLWYLHDKGLSTQNELCQLMKDAETFYMKGNV